MDLEKIAKNCQNLFRKIQNRKNGIFGRKSDFVNLNLSEFLNENNYFTPKI